MLQVQLLPFDTSNGMISPHLTPDRMPSTLNDRNAHQYLNLSTRAICTQGFSTNDVHRVMNTATISITSARIVSAEDRVDPAGSYYTAYVMQVESSGSSKSSTSSSLGDDSAAASAPSIHSTIVEHRYSEFARLHAELTANDITLRSSFPTKSICGRLGNWTPAAHWAPEKMAELVTYRKIKLDLWIIELTELLSRTNRITGEVRTMCLEFFQKPAGCPPCDRANPINWTGILAKDSSSKSSEFCSSSLADEVSFISMFGQLSFSFDLTIILLSSKSLAIPIK